jgi:hypothetical protein
MAVTTVVAKLSLLKPCPANLGPFSLRDRVAGHKLVGVPLASYVLAAAIDETAKLEARVLLNIHHSIEIWYGRRWIARFVREDHPLIGVQ